MPDQPNILLIMCDELRWCEVGCYGHRTIRTPHIDALAARGTRFETAVSNCPVCLPARSVVLSGQYSRRCTGGVGNVSLPLRDGGGVMPQWPRERRGHLQDPTLPELLRAIGYHTSAIGKWHIEAWPDAVGFDRYLIPAHQHANSAQWYCEDGGPLFSPPEYGVDYEAKRVGDFFRGRSASDEPFFLYYNISPPHMPLADAPDKYTTMYRRDEVVVRPNVDLDKPMPDWENMARTYLWDYRFYRDHLPYTMHLPDGCDLVELQRLYMGLTTWVDDTVGRVMADLTEAGLADNTLVIFTSDHGENLGSFQRWGKGALNEEAMRIPMICAGPDIDTAVTARIGSLVDLAPTLLTYAMGDAPAHMQGRSLLPALTGSDDLTDNHAFIETGIHGIGMRTHDRLVGLPWRFDRDTPAPAEPHELYDLAADPYELDNLATHSAAVTEAADLLDTLQQWHHDTPARC